jgi:DHA1 family bicyclomycin/chloramphenicol resistance-like MFS transporter
MKGGALRAEPHLATLVMAAAVGPLAMNVFLPSLPGMTRYFATDYAMMQLAVSLYLAATAVLQLGIGPASDRFGRRPVMIACIVIFLVGTVAAIYAPTIEVFLACRILQAFASAGLVISRAVVRDTVGTAESASRIGYVVMAMSAVPMFAPIIGGYLDELYGWQATFVLILGFGLLSLGVVHADLVETNRHAATSFAAQFRAYPELLSSRRFWGYSATAAFTSGAFFAFLGGGPFVATEILGLSPSAYGLYFGTISFGYMLGNYLSGRYSKRYGINRMMLMGNMVAASGMLVSILLFATGIDHPLALFAPVIFTGVGNGMTLPNANAGLVSVRPHLAGSASGLGGALQIGGGAALAALVGALLDVESGPFPLLWMMFLSSSAALLTTLYVRRIARLAGEVE